MGDETHERRNYDKRLNEIEVEVGVIKNDVGDIKDNIGKILDNMSDIRPPTDIKTILYVILASVTITSSIIASANWLISNQMQVPLEQMEVLRTAIDKTNVTVSKVASNQQIILNDMGTWTDKVKNNTDFTNQYMYIDKVPVEQQKIKGRLDMLEEQMNMINTSIHNGKFMKGGR